MAEVSRISKPKPAHSELERLAPRFTLAAAVLSVFVMAIATWGFDSLSGELYSAYAAQVFDVTPYTWATLWLG